MKTLRFAPPNLSLASVPKRPRVTSARREKTSENHRRDTLVTAEDELSDAELDQLFASLARG